MSQKIKTSVEIDGSLSASQIPNATTDTDKFLVSDGGNIKYRTGVEMLSDLGVAPGTASKIQHPVKAGVAITKGQAVYVIDANGTNMIVGLASNSSEATSSKTMGLLNATVSINGFADVIAEGLLSGLDTSTATAGNPVWLGTNGNLIYGLTNKPSAPNHLVFIGIVTRVNANNGEIFVKVQNGFELEELHNVDLKTTVPVNGHLLGYDGTLWVNKTIAGWLGFTPANAVTTISTTSPLQGGGDLSGNRTLSILQANSTTAGYLSSTDWNTFNNKQSALGYTPANSTTTITINGVSQDLSTNRSWTIASGITSFNTRTGAITLTSGDVTTALGYTPYNSTNPSGYISSYTETDTLATVTGRGASTSTLSTFDGGLNIGNAKLRWGGTTSPTLGFPFTGGPNAFWIDVNDGDTGGLAIDNDGTTIYGAGDSGHVFRVIDEDVYQATSNVDASTTFRVQQGQNGGGYVRGIFEVTDYLVGNNSVRGPIFYDSNDTAYYGDFNSTTKQYQAISFGDSTRYSAINTTINGSGAGDKLILYGGTSNYDARLLVGTDYDILFKSQGAPSGKGSYKFYSGTSAALALTIDASQGLRAGTSYNTSPASTYFSHTLAGVGTNRVVNFDGNGTTPSVWWTNGSRAYAAIDAKDPGMTFWANNGSGWQQQMEVNYGNVTINTDIRSPIFYDSNNTGYYVDPASTSNLNVVVVNGGNGVGVVRSGGSNDPYGTLSVSAPSGDNYAYMGFTRNGVIGMAMGIDTSNNYWIGSSGGGYNAVRTSTYMTVSSGGTITATADVVAYSDRRVKENIETIENALDKVTSLRGVTYNRTDKEDKSQKIGVIAQEVQEILPQVVFEQADGMLGVSYGNITAVLIEAIKEQSLIIDKLTKRLEILENK